jgi:hypothetical protein
VRDCCNVALGFGTSNGGSGVVVVNVENFAEMIQILCYGCKGFGDLTLSFGFFIDAVGTFSVNIIMIVKNRSWIR